MKENQTVRLLPNGTITPCDDDDPRRIGWVLSEGDLAMRRDALEARPVYVSFSDLRESDKSTHKEVEEGK